MKFHGHLLNGQDELAKNSALWFKNLFGDDYYLEVQANTMKEQYLVNQKLFKLSKEIGVPLVATNDAHYLKKKMHIIMKFYCVFKLVKE